MHGIEGGVETPTAIDAKVRGFFLQIGMVGQNREVNLWIVPQGAREMVAIFVEVPPAWGKRSDQRYPNGRTLEVSRFQHSASPWNVLRHA
jgi:hypothetical protein